MAKAIMPGNIRRADHFINFMKRVVFFGELGHFFQKPTEIERRP
jgi:hypothetical protein